MENIMEKFIEVLRSNPDHAFDFICQKGHLFTKYELQNVVKELLYAIHYNLTEMEHDEILSDTADELSDTYSED